MASGYADERRINMNSKAFETEQQVRREKLSKKLKKLGKNPYQSPEWSSPPEMAMKGNGTRDWPFEDPPKLPGTQDWGQRY